jgi:hypothetical protein
MNLLIIEDDAEAVVNKINAFFEHMIPFHHPDNHAKINAAKTAAVAAVILPSAPAIPESSTLDSTATPTTTEKAVSEDGAFTYQV